MLSIRLGEAHQTKPFSSETLAYQEKHTRQRVLNLGAGYIPTWGKWGGLSAPKLDHNTSREFCGPPSPDVPGCEGLCGLAGAPVPPPLRQRVTRRQLRCRAGNPPEALECLSTEKVKSLQTLGGAAVSHKADSGPPGGGKKGERDAVSSR